MPLSTRYIRLNLEQKEFVLQRLAREHSPSIVVAELQQEYGITITRQAVDSYKKRFPEIVQAKRKSFLESMSGIPLFEKAERITELQKLYDDLIKISAGIRTKEIIETLQGLIAQIQKEVEPLKISGEGFANSSPVFIIQSNGHEPKTEDKSQDISKRFRLEPISVSGDGLGMGDRKNDVRDS